MFLVDVAVAAMRISTPTIVAAVGETFSERAGVINVHLEGMMLTGAFCGVLGAYASSDPFVGLLAGIGGGLLIATIHGVVTVTLGGNQIVSGIALNLLAIGVTSYLLDVFFPGQNAVAPGLSSVSVPGLADLPGVGRVFFRQSLAVYFMYALVPLSIFLLYRTRWGLRVLAAGENPLAADTLGVSVAATRYQAVLVAGALAGLGGAILALSQLSFFVDNLTQGRGFIALAAVLFGNWRPGYVALAALLFGFADALQLRLQAFGIGVPPELMTMLPYVLTLIVLAGFVGRSRPPRYFGVPYIREER